MQGGFVNPFGELVLQNQNQDARHVYFHDALEAVFIKTQKIWIIMVNMEEK